MLSSVALFCMVFHSHAQNTVGVYASTGYAFGIGGRYVGTSEFKNPDKDHYSNMGSGIRINAGGSYKLLDNLYVKGGFTYTHGFPAVTIYDSVNLIITYAEQSIKYQHSRFGIPVYVQHYVRILELIDMYIQLGTGITFNFSSREIEQFDHDDALSLDAEATLIDKNSISLPLYGAVGVDYPLNDFAFLVAEIGFEASNITLYGYEATESKNLNVLSGYSGNVNYEKNANDRQQPRKTPASNIYMHIGTRFFIY